MNTKRIEEIQKETAYPDSLSVQHALFRVWKECEQEKVEKNLRITDVLALDIPAVSGSALMSEFWKESADLIEKYRDDCDERAAQGVVSCRILIDRLIKQLENDR